MVAHIKTQVTFAEYAALPESNQIIELIDGEIVVNPPLDVHQKILWQIVAALMPLLKKGEARFAPTSLYLDDRHSFEPDLFWVSETNDRCALGADGRFWHGAPDLVVEILSPSTAYHNRGIKFELYEQYGVREYWLVDPEAQFVEVYRRGAERFERIGVYKADQTFTSTVLDGATINPQPWFSE